ncbi:transporter [Streptococcus gordonii]|nr:transporter [Streptococcus gordonii]
MIEEIGQALLETKAQVAYVCNIMTQRGETEHFTDANHVEVLHRHLGQKFIDTVLVNIENVPKDYMNCNKFDEYLVQVEHDFKGLQEKFLVSFLLIFYVWKMVEPSTMVI